MATLDLAKIRKSLAKQKLDGLIISSVSNITYLTNYSNFSKDEREAYLLITKDKQFIFTDARYSEAIKKTLPEFELLQISSDAPFKKHAEGLVKTLYINNVGIEEHNLTFAEFKSFKKIFKKISPFEIHSVRMIKNSLEIENIQQACKVGDQTFQFLLTKISSNFLEKELAFELEFNIKKSGADISFNPIVAFSANSSIPHHHTGDTKLGEKKGQFVLLDFGAKVNNYCSDMTRTVFWGKASQKQKKIYETVLIASEKAAEFITKSLEKKQKIKASTVDKVARGYILSKGFPSIPHSLGHGIGLEVHEAPYLSVKSKTYLEEGMVFSIEPGVYIPDFGGVRIEDLFVIEKNRLKQLTNSPKKLIEL